ncbi:MAG: hypothetical protein U0175_25050 [Caldilineaceae bacterium]
MKQFRLLSLLVGLLLLTISACNAIQPAPATSNPPNADDNLPPALEPSNFSHPTQIDNPWLPMPVGTHFVYEGTNIQDDGTAVPHRLEVTVTDLTKMIGGVPSVVTWDTDYEDGILVEAEVAFYAQDDAGTVWRMGEYPEEFADGKFLQATSWIHGIEGALAGIEMPADPQLGTPSYAQGWGPAVDWSDRGQVDQMGQQLCVPSQCYDNVLIIAETTKAEPDAVQLKSFAQGVGNIYVGWRGSGEMTKEVLQLTKVEKLSDEALAEARTQALLLEQHGYQVSKNVYALTIPIELPPGVKMPDLSAAVPAQSTENEQPAISGVPSAEIVIYAADLPESAMSEMGFTDDPASPGGKLIDLPNLGEELDPPPEDDPHTTFTVQVLEGIPYHCWIHLKVGEAKGVSTANMVYVQMSDAEDAAGNVILLDNTDSYLIAQGPDKAGWAWAPCAFKDAAPEASLIRFGTTGEVTVRIQAGMEGVGFDQFVLSSEKYLKDAPTDAVVSK